MWFNQTRFKPGKVRFSIVDILSWTFCFCAWFSLFTNKIKVLMMVLHHRTSIHFISILAPLPPAGMSLIFSLIITICLCGWQPTAPRTCGIHLAIFAAIVVILDSAELVLALWPLFEIGWYKAFATGFMLKYTTLSLLMQCIQCLLRFPCYQSSRGFIGNMLLFWLHAHRYAIDMLVSVFVFWTMAPLAPIDWIRNQLCPGCSIHQLLIYRDPGHLVRAEAEVWRNDWSSYSLRQDARASHAGLSASREPLAP